MCLEPERRGAELEHGERGGQAVLQAGECGEAVGLVLSEGQDTPHIACSHLVGTGDSSLPWKRYA